MVPASNLRQCPLLLHISTALPKPPAGSPPVPGGVSAPVSASFCTFHADQSSAVCSGSVRWPGGKRNSDASSIFVPRTILPGFISPAGSNRSLISSKARQRRGPNCQPTHSVRTSPSPCSPENAPLYSRTIALASSAIARILAAPSRRMSRIGRTCSVPTDACAYQVPRVPCRAKTCVNRSTYSARCSSGTAQSSMNDTGLPSPFKLIMMLSPALRTSHSARCAPASVISTTLPGKPRSPISATRSRRRRGGSSRVSPMNSTSRIASGSPISARSITARNAGLPRARSIMVRSTSSTADGRSPTRCRALSIALYSVGKLTTPSARCAGSGASLNVSSRDHASVPSLPTSRCA